MTDPHPDEHTCPACQATVSDLEANFCSVCGKALWAPLEVVEPGVVTVSPPREVDPEAVTIAPPAQGEVPAEVPPPDPEADVDEKEEELVELTPLAEEPPPYSRMSGGAWLGVAVLILALLGTLGVAIQSIRQLEGSTSQSAELIVADETAHELFVWLEHEDGRLQALPARSTVSPGRVRMRITRRDRSDRERVDVVEMTLRPGQRHVVVVGDHPVRRRERIPAEGLPAPGVVVPEERGDRGPRKAEIRDDIRSDDPVLILFNPFVDPVACELRTEAWARELMLPGRTWRPVGYGDAANVTVFIRRAGDGRLLEKVPLSLPQRLVLFTVGGATAYAWTRLDTYASVEAAPPPVPQDHLTVFPDGVSASPNEPGTGLLVVRYGDDLFELVPLASSPPPAPAAGDPPSLRVHASVQLEELDLGPALAGKVVASVAPRGASLVGVVDGDLWDLSAGVRLVDASPRLLRVASGPSGLAIVNARGELGILSDGAVHIVRQFDDPTRRLACVSGTEVVTFAGTLDQPLAIHRRLDDGEDETLSETRFTTAVRQAGAWLLVATGQSVERVRFLHGLAAIREPILELPAGDDAEPIVAVEEVGGSLVFSTPTCVSILSGDLVLPLVEGLGGGLYAWRDGLLVHDMRSKRLYVLRGPALGDEGGK